MTTHVVALSMGDPAGIGPELVLKAAADRTLTDLARLAVVGSEKVLRKHAAILGTSFDLPVVPIGELKSGGVPGPVVVDVDTPGVEGVELGRASAAGGRASIACVERALELVQAGIADALVTGPINKVAIGLAEKGADVHTISFLVNLSSALVQEYQRLYRSLDIVAHRKTELAEVFKKNIVDRSGVSND